MAAEKTAWLDGRITDEGLAHMRSFIGVERPVRGWNSAATLDGILHFLLGIGDDNPLYWDEAYAARTRWGGVIAPPAFLYSCSSGGTWKGQGTPSMAQEFLPGTFGLWANDRWHYFDAVRAGERVTVTTQVYDVQEKRSSFSGRSATNTEKTSYFGQDGRLVAEQYRTILRFERSGSRERGRYLDTPEARYSEEDQAQIYAQYEREPAQRRGAEPRYWEEVRPGEPLITLVKGPLTITNIAGWLMGWGSPLCQTNRIAYEYLREYPTARLYNPETGIEDTLEGAHWDSYLARQSGMARGYDFGAQRISWLSHLVTDWMGDDGFLTDLHVHLRRPNLLGDTSWLTGSVTGKRMEDGQALVDLELTSTNQRNEVNANGVATVRLPTRG